MLQVRSVFTTDEQSRKADWYFLDSADRVSFFLEDGEAGAETDKLLRLNKVGHALHDLDPTFRAFSRSAKVAAVCRSLGFARPTPVQSMYIFKHPKVGGEVNCHQDSTFLATSPYSCVGLWWAVVRASLARPLATFSFHSPSTFSASSRRRQWRAQALRAHRAVAERRQGW